MTEGEKEDTEKLQGALRTGAEEDSVEEAVPEEIPLPPPDLTGRLNKHLLTSFLDRLNTGQVSMLADCTNQEPSVDDFED